MKNLLPTYEGSKPYVFVSYSRKDSDRVFPIIQHLQTEGINIFYKQDDDFIEDLTDNIVKRILNCQCFIAFHSNNSKNSVRCKNEVSFACRCHQKIISIYLDDVELSLGVQMAVHQFPAINFYEYEESELENFYLELLSQIKSSSSSLTNDSPSVYGVAGIGMKSDWATAGHAILSAAGTVSAGSIGSAVAKGVGLADAISSIIPNPFKVVKKFFSGKKNPKTKSSEYISAVESNLFAENNPLEYASPYEGNKPYAFVSYSHSDLNIVLEILNKLQVNGLRFWYDAGIQHGSEWDECIAEHISSCECMVAFHSRSSNRSPHCKNEISFLNFKGTDKKILSIYLDDVKLSKGTQMNINRFQAINFYGYQQKENFYSTLIKSPIIQTCLQ